MKCESALLQHPKITLISLSGMKTGLTCQSLLLLFGLVPVADDVEGRQHEEDGAEELETHRSVERRLAAKNK